MVHATFRLAPVEPARFTASYSIQAAPAAQKFDPFGQVMCLPLPCMLVFITLLQGN